MKNCRFCNSVELVKHGIINGKQRYLCKNCHINQMEIDTRQKYDEKVKLAAIAMFQEGLSLRAVARLLNDIFGLKISYQLVQMWFYKMHNKLKEKIEKKPIESRKIPILEMDELFTFVKKK